MRRHSTRLLRTVTPTTRVLANTPMTKTQKMRPQRQGHHILGSTLMMGRVVPNSVPIPTILRTLRFILRLFSGTPLAIPGILNIRTKWEKHTWTIVGPSNLRMRKIWLTGILGYVIEPSSRFEPGEVSQIAH